MIGAGDVAKRLAVAAKGEAGDRVERGACRPAPAARATTVSSPSPRTMTSICGSAARISSPVVGREDAAVDDGHARAGPRGRRAVISRRSDAPRSSRNGRPARMSGASAQRVGDDRGQAHRGRTSASSRRTSWPASISGPPIASRPERRQMLVGDAAADRRCGGFRSVMRDMGATLADDPRHWNTQSADWHLRQA